MAELRVTGLSANGKELMRKLLSYIILFLLGLKASAQHSDSLRIINFNSYFSLHIDSTNVYRFQINHPQVDYYWYLQNAPIGLTINKDDGSLIFRAAKNYFLSGKLKYDKPYKVGLGVQSLIDPNTRIDTSFTIQFYNTEITPSRIKPSVANSLTIEEGEPISFRVQCETGTFPFESILFSSSIPISDYTLVRSCNDEFKWTPDFDFVKDTETQKEKTVVLSFIGITRFQAKDTSTIRVLVRNALNYPHAKEEFALLTSNARKYVLELKFAFLQLDKKLKRVKTFRTVFDLTSGSSALTGTILNTSSNPSSQKLGKVFPSIGVALVPVKEATAPNKAVEQNQASQLRAAIKRLEYIIADNQLAGEKDIDILRKTNKLKEELKQTQVQLIDIPTTLTGGMTEEELNAYFNSPKVNKKYRLKRSKKGSHDLPRANLPRALARGC